MMSEQIFTDDDLSQSAIHGHKLDPAYFTARRVMEQFMAAFTDEHLDPLIKKVTDQIFETVHDQFESYLFDNAELNTAGAIERMVGDTVKALLSGDGWAMQRYPLAAAYDAVHVRAAIAKHIPNELAAARIADLETKLAKLEADLQRLRERERY